MSGTVFFKTAFLWFLDPRGLGMEPLGFVASALAAQPVTFRPLCLADPRRATALHCHCLAELGLGSVRGPGHIPPTPARSRRRRPGRGGGEPGAAERPLHVATAGWAPTGSVHSVCRALLETDSGSDGSPHLTPSTRKLSGGWPSSGSPYSPSRGNPGPFTGRLLREASWGRPGTRRGPFGARLGKPRTPAPPVAPPAPCPQPRLRPGLQEDR